MVRASTRASQPPSIGFVHSHTGNTPSIDPSNVQPSTRTCSRLPILTSSFCRAQTSANAVAVSVARRMISVGSSVRNRLTGAA